ncbi:MAG: UDP-N-acetylmuramoyl-tripeptide--D-alanyl-D-alanine ligase [Prevotellaceae bacterium]|nr:UDP-N-acetylmuramoyl-tripeptide--D-alanyl-D-alanine ligase [Prevotellaceae bacterium]
MDIKEIFNIVKTHMPITTDSRDCPEGSVFLALRGETFDGNKFAVSALQKGCAIAIVDNADIIGTSGEQVVFSDNGTAEISLENGRQGMLILVDNTLQTYKDLAREHRRRFNIPIVGVTGTNGKTTTKELIAAVLGEKYNVHYTRGNFNNDVGVPKTLFQLSNEHEIAVIEMGASHPGDIKTLVETVEPTCGIITNVGRAHLQGFGSFEGVKRTKGELYDFLINNVNASSPSPIFINADNADLMEMAKERKAPKLIEYGKDTADEVTVRGKVIDCAPFLRFSWQADGGAEHEVKTHLIGAYNIDNMLAAATIGLHFGVSEEQVCHALENYTPTNNRSQLTVTAHNHLIVDAYNANPTSMKAAVDNLAAMNVPAKMAILGDMRELGEVTGEEHQRIVDLLKSKGLNDIWLVGEEFGKTDCAFRKFKDVEEVKSAIAECQPQGKYILIKGSNSMRLYTLPEVL